MTATASTDTNAAKIVSLRLFKVLSENRSLFKCNSDTEISEYVGVGKRHFSDLKNGRRIASTEIICRIIDATKVNPLYIFLGEGKQFLVN